MLLVAESYWFGLENMRKLVEAAGQRHHHFNLIAHITTAENSTYQAVYDNFTLGPESEGYPLRLCGFLRLDGRKYLV